jgi:hypothetical protein
MPEIETHRLRLRPITLDDLLALVNLQWALLIERVRMAEVGGVLTAACRCAIMDNEKREKGDGQSTGRVPQVSPAAATG